MNFAIENGKKFFMFYDNKSDFMSIIDIDKTGKRFENWGEWLINKALCHATLRDCLNSINSYQKPVMYKGVNINVWVRDVLLSVDYYGNVHATYHYNDVNLRKMEA